jgi:hypothetical protein
LSKDQGNIQATVYFDINETLNDCLFKMLISEGVKEKAELVTNLFTLELGRLEFQP